MRVAGLVGIVTLAITTNFLVLVGGMIILGGAIGLLLPGNLAAMSLATGVKAQGKVAGINTLAMGVGLVVGPTAGTAIYHASPVAPVLDRDPGAGRPRGGRLLRRQAEGCDCHHGGDPGRVSCRGHTPATLSSRSARSGCRSAKLPARVATRHSRRPSMRLVHLVLSLLVSLFLLTAATAAERAIVVLDGSGSMWAQIDGKARIEIARETLNEVLGGLPQDLELGFMSYGHRTKGDCSDIELMVPPAAGTAQQIIDAAASISPKGKTPISAAVKQAAEALGYTEEKATVILITDGIETCDADPCQIGTDLETAGIDFTAHVIGFGLSDEEGQEVACLAENTGGMYLPASGGAALIEALNSTVAQVERAVAGHRAGGPAARAGRRVQFPADRRDGRGRRSAAVGLSMWSWEVYSRDSDGNARRVPLDRVRRPHQDRPRARQLHRRRPASARHRPASR